MKKNSFLLRSSLVIIGVGFCIYLMTSCEGPAGLQGKDANETCKQCHNPQVVDQKMTEYRFSKHYYGEAGFEEAGSAGCSPCHESEAFKYVSTQNIPATFTLNATTGKYVNNYVSKDSATIGQFTCNTCHINIHKTYQISDFFPLTTTAPVAMNMWGGTKTIDLTQDDSKSNLCVKCHQPRPITTSTSLSTGNVIDYSALASNPASTFYTPGGTGNTLIPGYRTGIHYGTAGAIFAGKGGVEFDGSLDYTSSAHTTVASCQNCHMAEMTGRSGGHTFFASGNFKGCNVSGCHAASPLSSNAAKYTDTRNTIKTLLNQLGSKLTSGGISLLHTDPDPESNLWAGLTTANYDANLNIYDPSANPGGALRNPSPSGSWTTEQRNTNSALPTFTLLNVQMGGFVNFQLVLRDYSLGVHNYAYTRALLTNTIEALTAAGF